MIIVFIMINLNIHVPVKYSVHSKINSICKLKFERRIQALQIKNNLVNDVVMDTFLKQNFCIKRVYGRSFRVKIWMVVPQLCFTKFYEYVMNKFTVCTKYRKSHAHQQRKLNDSVSIGPVQLNFNALSSQHTRKICLDYR